MNDLEKMGIISASLYIMADVYLKKMESEGASEGTLKPLRTIRKKALKLNVLIEGHRAFMDEVNAVFPVEERAFLLASAVIDS